MFSVKINFTDDLITSKVLENYQIYLVLCSAHETHYKIDIFFTVT